MAGADLPPPFRGGLGEPGPVGFWVSLFPLLAALVPQLSLPSVQISFAAWKRGIRVGLQPSCADAPPALLGAPVQLPHGFGPIP